MTIHNNVKKLKVISPEDFLKLEFNTLKDEKRDVKKLINSIKKTGWNFPVYLWAGHNFVIDGAGRKKAVEELLKQGEEIKEIPVVEIHAETLEEAKAKVLEVSSQFGEITKESFLNFTQDIELDYDTFEIDGMTADAFIESEEKDDEVPETPEEPKSKLGDLYELGGHRLICGDCTDESVVNRLTKGELLDVSFTSPPYNVGHNLGYEGKDSKYIHEDNNADYQDLIVKSTYNSLEYAKDVFVNLQFLANNKKELLLWLAELADNFKDIFFWKKLQVAPAIAENVANSQTEVIVLFGKNNNSRAWGNIKWRGNFSNSIETNSATTENKNSKIHNATFPVSLPLAFLKQGYGENSKVLDLFAGTGTTMIACEKMKQKCYMVDLEPLYCDVIVQRYIDYVDNPKVIKNGVDETHLWKKTPKKTE